MTDLYNKSYCDGPNPSQDKPLPDTAQIYCEYYNRPFLFIQKDISRFCHDITVPHPIRERFWQLIPIGEYSSERGRVFINSYIASLKAELANTLNKLSIAYCIHLYRRLSPGPIGRDKSPHTIVITRAVLESAIQKYAQFQLCDKIANSASIKIEKVLSGLLMNPEFNAEKVAVSTYNQLVLTKFSSVDLLNFYNLEKLAYEIWKSSAALRTTGKGAPLSVVGYPDYFCDNRSDELDFLVTNYDGRIGKSGWSFSASGVVFPDKDNLSTEGLIFLPTYNVSEVTSKEYKDFISEAFHVNLLADITFNFNWIDYNLRDYLKSHLPYADAFYERYGVSLNAVLLVVAALSLRVVSSWQDKGFSAFYRYSQRAYEICTVDFIFKEILFILPLACKTLDIDESSFNENDIQEAIYFWTLDKSKRSSIDLSYSGPHYIFLRIKANTVLIDYAWVIRRLRDLFFSIKIQNQNFKGTALENIIRDKPSDLPTGPCKAFSGEKRQIDYALSLNDYLVIAECKAVSMSIGFDRGDPRAIKYRSEKVVKRALHEVDEKAQWLSRNPKGTNYDITMYKYIVPLAISPFVEFIPSQNTHYWISKIIPRVLTPVEFEKVTGDFSNIVNSFNKVPLK